MTEKNEIKGDVGQLVMGDSNVGTSLNNVVNLNMGGDEEKNLTWLQRNEITKKVKKLSSVSGLSALKIYRELLNKFGADKMDNFPRNKFNEACEYIETKLAEFEDENLEQDMPDDQQTTLIQEVPCKNCQANSVLLKKTNFKLHVLFGLMVLMMITEAVFLMVASPAKASQERLTIDRPVEQSCHYDGKIHSIGSTVRMADGIIRQCMDAPSDAPSYWVLLSKGKL
ncbi:hypothetical protein [Undibacterium umbellatum]|uniref:DUF1496 domain-containing protein n=1 Tax=Undibacterium umbellatum TaxID=2762300 RepID=A0ABR6ZI97_9BURK|nr:hypothetical protein [Undibacterium umbellatum]MBC3911399.1 hypothetical protein [Undibacterium umbellatum]